MWRQAKIGDGRWHGLGVIVLATGGGAWVNMRGALWRVANEQMRPATNEESLGAEIVNRYLADLRIDLKRSRGQRKFVDVEKEGIPRFPEDGENSDEAAPDEEDREQQQNHSSSRRS